MTGAFLIGVVFVIFRYLAPETQMVALGSIGSGYASLQLMMYNMVPLSVLIMIPFMKIFMFSFPISSGGFGGVLHLVWQLVGQQVITLSPDTSGEGVVTPMNQTRQLVTR